MNDHTILEEEGDAWHRRNSGTQTRLDSDPVLAEIATWALRRPPAQVLEIGCAAGSRLSAIHDRYQSTCFGVEGSSVAVQEGSARHPAVKIEQGIAPSCLTQFDDGSFDLVILGFMQYLIPREWEFNLATQIDRLLSTGGRVVAYDFLSPIPSTREYSHQPALTT